MALARKKRCAVGRGPSAAVRSSRRRPSRAWTRANAGRSHQLGVDLVCFSGDKLFGGPQAGIIVGRTRMIAALKRAPLFRALRCDKLILSALESQSDAYLRGNARIPVLEMMHITSDDLRSRAERIIAALEGRRSASAWAAAGHRLAAVRSSIRAAVGDDRGGSSHAWSTSAAAALREQPEPVIAYVGRGTVKLDLRTIFPPRTPA